MSRDVLFAHERPAFAHAARHVLRQHGYTTTFAPDGHAARLALEARRFAALVVDVALPGIAGYELADVAKTLAASGERGAPVVVLVPSVFRHTSYKRKPERLYGADDYVELHHLGDMLPAKLDRLLGISPPARAPEHTGEGEGEAAATRLVHGEGDRRMDATDPHGLAALLVADLVLYNGDRILGATDGHAARAALADDLAIVREIYGQATPTAAAGEHDPIDLAFESIMRALGRPLSMRGGEVPS